MTKAVQQVTQGLKVREIKTGALTCGNCSGLTREALIAGVDSTCNDQGKMATSNACPKFRASAFDLQDSVKGGTQLLDIAKIFSKLEPKDLVTVAGAMLNETITRSHGVKFYQPVYVRYRGTANANYMSNFMSARILDVSDTTVRVISDDGCTVMTFGNTGFEGPSIYSQKNFQPLRTLMIEEERAVDPKIHENRTSRILQPDEGPLDAPKRSLDGYIGTIDTVVQANSEHRKDRNRRRNAKKKGRTAIKRGEALTLCDLVSVAENSHLSRFGEESTDNILTDSDYKRKVLRKTGSGSSVLELSEI